MGILAATYKLIGGRRICTEEAKIIFEAYKILILKIISPFSLFCDLECLAEEGNKRMKEKIQIPREIRMCFSEENRAILKVLKMQFLAIYGLIKQLC